MLEPRDFNQKLKVNQWTVILIQSKTCNYLGLLRKLLEYMEFYCCKFGLLSFNHAPRMVHFFALFLQVIVFVIALVLRFSPQTLMIGRVLYCIEIVFWYLKSLEFLSVNKYVGPYITMVGKMVS